MLTCVLALGCALCPSASAEVGVPAGTTQAVADDALFLQYAPAPATPGTICLLDSGVNASPDTTPTLAGSYALSANTGSEDELAALNPTLAGGHPDGHGTYMAMIAAAPANGWGMVGIAPSSVRVYNLKALAAGQTSFGFAEYAAAISRCQALSSTMPITVVNLSLGSSSQPTGSELETLENYIQSARAHNLSIVAAAGNEGGPAQAPASLPGVFGVGAFDASPAASGAICPFSNRGTGVAVLAAGCDSHAGGIEVAFSDNGEPARAEGTSEAGLILSAAEASMRAYSPTITADRAQECITSTLAGGANLDVKAAFDACGLEQIVSEGTAAYQAANSTPLAAQGLPGPAAATLPTIRPHPPRKPKIERITFSRHRLTVVLGPIPRGLRARLLVQQRNRLGRLIVRARITTIHTRTTVRVKGWDRLSASYLEGTTQLPAVVATRMPAHRQVPIRPRR